ARFPRNDLSTWWKQLRLAALFCSAGFDVAGADHGLDVAAYVEIAVHVYFERVAGGNEIREDLVDHVLVEDLHLAERIDVELERLQLDAAPVGHVHQIDRGEVREVREGTDRRELRHRKIDLDALAGIFVLKGVERAEVHLFDGRRANFKLLFRRHLT